MTAPKSSLLRPFLLAATLATGFGIVWCSLGLWFGSSILEAWPQGERPPREALVVRSDGTLLISSTPANDLSQTSYRDLSGAAQEVPRQNELVPALIVNGAAETTGFLSSPPGWVERLQVFGSERDLVIRWYFVHDGRADGAGYFVGYERVSNRRVGFIGLAGFRPKLVPASEWIPVRTALIMGNPSWSSMPAWYRLTFALRPDRFDVPPRLVHVPSGNRLRLVDLSARTVATVFEAPEPIEAVGVPALSTIMRTQLTHEQSILVRTKQKVYALDHRYSLIHEFTIPPEIDRRSSVSWYETGDGGAIADWALWWSGDDAGKHIVYRVAAGGAVEKKFELILQSGWGGMTRQAVEFLVALGFPGPALLIAAEASIVKMEEVPGEDYPATIQDMLRGLWPLLLGELVLSSILAAIAWRRCRACGLSRRDQVVWGVFVLLFGVPAMAGFLLFRRWPVCEPCPSCHARVARDRAGCVACGARSSAPELKGIEIFA